jgi:hypothetical protein
MFRFVAVPRSTGGVRSEVRMVLQASLARQSAMDVGSHLRETILDLKREAIAQVPWRERLSKLWVGGINIPL